MNVRKIEGRCTGNLYKKGMVVSRQPIFIVNLKSNTMKNTMQIYCILRNSPKNFMGNILFLNYFSI